MTTLTDIHANLLSKRDDLANVVISMKEQLIHSDATIRTNAIQQINQLMTMKPNIILTNTQFESLLQFYLSKLNETNVPLLRESLNGLQLILDQYYPHETHEFANTINLSKAILESLNRSFDDVQAYPQSVRKLVFDLVHCLIQRFPNQTLNAITQSIRVSQEDSLLDWMIHAIDGEKDPRNLLVAFDLIKYFSRFLSDDPASKISTDRTERMFAVISCYFPITFTPPPSLSTSLNQSISKHDLQISLRAAMTSCTSFIPSVLALLIDRLLDDDTINDADIAQDCFETMTAVFAQTYNQSSDTISKRSIGSLVAPFSFQCWQTLRKHWLIHCKLSTYASHPSEALNALQSCIAAFISVLCPDSINGVSSMDVVNGYQSTLMPLVEEFIDEFRLVDSTIARQYSCMIPALFRHSNNAKLRLISKLLAPLVEQWNAINKPSNHMSTSHESQRVALLETICTIASVCQDYKPSFELVKLDILKIISESMDLTSSATTFALAVNCAASIASHMDAGSETLLSDDEANNLIDRICDAMNRSTDLVYGECCCRALVAIASGRPEKVFAVLVQPILQRLLASGSNVESDTKPTGQISLLGDDVSWLCSACVAHPYIFNQSLPLLVRTLFHSMNRAITGDQVAVLSISDILSVIDIAVQHYAGSNDRSLIESVPFMKSIPLLVIGLLLVCSINLTAAHSNHLIDAKVIETCTNLSRTATAAITISDNQSIVIDACQTLLLAGECSPFITFIESQDSTIQLHNRERLVRISPLLSVASSDHPVLSNSYRQLLIVVAAAVGSACPAVVSRRADLLLAVVQHVSYGPVRALSACRNQWNSEQIASYRAVASMTASLLNKFDTSNPAFATAIREVHTMTEKLTCSERDDVPSCNRLGLIESVSLSVKALSLRGHLEWQNLMTEYFKLLSSSDFLQQPSLCNAWPLLFNVCLLDGPAVLSKRCHALTGIGSMNKQRFLIWSVTHLTQHIQSITTHSQQSVVTEESTKANQVRLVLLFRALCLAIDAAPAGLIVAPIKQLELIGFAVRALSMSDSRPELELSAVLALRKLIATQQHDVSGQLSVTLNSELNTLVPSLLHALQSKSHATVQASLDCIDHLACLPFEMLYPHVQNISQATSRLTDHPLRDVRRRATNMKTQWLQLTRTI